MFLEVFSSGCTGNSTPISLFVTGVRGVEEYLTFFSGSKLKYKLEKNPLELNQD